MSHGEYGPGLACLNCGAIPAGPWCQHCGQKAGPAHRSVSHLLGELIELLTHADSRIWSTLRLLVLHPARLTRDFLCGRRVRQIPPLRLFFVILLLLFTAGAVCERGAFRIDLPDDARTGLQTAIDRIATGAPRLDHWLRPRLHQAVRQPDAVVTTMTDWLERFTLLMLPVAAMLLWLGTVSQWRHFTLFDHLVVSIHSLSFAGLVQIAVFLSGLLIPDAALLLLVLPVHLFGHLRGVYGGGALLTLSRMALLGLGSGVAVIGLLVALAAVGLQFGTG